MILGSGFTCRFCLRSFHANSDTACLRTCLDRRVLILLIFCCLPPACHATVLPLPAFSALPAGSLPEPALPAAFCTVTVFCRGCGSPACLLFCCLHFLHLAFRLNLHHVTLPSLPLVLHFYTSPVCVACCQIPFGFPAPFPTCRSPAIPPAYLPHRFLVCLPGLLCTCLRLDAPQTPAWLRSACRRPWIPLPVRYWILGLVLHLATTCLVSANGLRHCILPLEQRSAVLCRKPEQKPRAGSGSMPPPASDGYYRITPYLYAAACCAVSAWFLGFCCRFSFWILPLLHTPAAVTSFCNGSTPPPPFLQLPFPAADRLPGFLLPFRCVRSCRSFCCRLPAAFCLPAVLRLPFCVHLPPFLAVSTCLPRHCLRTPAQFSTTTILRFLVFCHRRLLRINSPPAHILSPYGFTLYWILHYSAPSSAAVHRTAAVFCTLPPACWFLTCRLFIPAAPAA